MNACNVVDVVIHKTFVVLIHSYLVVMITSPRRLLHRMHTTERSA